MASTFELKESSQCEQIYSFYDRDSGLKAIIAIHNTSLGPAIGGCRMIDYISEDHALNDVINLAKSMTYKAVMAGVKYGGGKSVIINSKKKVSREALFTVFGKLVDKLQGRYITAIDSGTTMEDMEIVSRQTKYVTGYEHQNKGLLDPSYYTAHGVIQSLYAAIKYKYNSTKLIGKKILIKGVGNVGYNLAKFLYAENANLFICDIDIAKCKKCEYEFNATIVKPNEIFNYSYDIICPCDTGYTVTEQNINDIRTNILIGATNNQLENDALADELTKRNILYCPDYVVNSGGLIYVTELYENNPTRDIMNKIRKLTVITEQVLRYAYSEKISTKAAADKIVENRLMQ